MFHLCASLYLNRGERDETVIELHGRGQSWSSLLFLVIENQMLNTIANNGVAEEQSELHLTLFLYDREGPVNVLQGTRNTFYSG
jgi:hypothetical protein